MKLQKKINKAGYEVACIADENDENKVKIFYKNRINLSSKIIEFASKITSINKIAFTCKNVLSIPKTSSGKINYNKLKEIQC